MSLMSIKRFPHFPMFRKIFILRNRLYQKIPLYLSIRKPLSLRLPVPLFTQSYIGGNAVRAWYGMRNTTIPFYHRGG